MVNVRRYPPLVMSKHRLAYSSRLMIAALAPISITVPLDVPTGTYVPVTGVALKWTPIAPAVKPPVML